VLLESVRINNDEFIDNIMILSLVMRRDYHSGVVWSMEDEASNYR
jgi:hypothetical protein